MYEYFKELNNNLVWLDTKTTLCLGMRQTNLWHFYEIKIHSKIPPDWCLIDLIDGESWDKSFQECVLLNALTLVFGEPLSAMLRECHWQV